MDLIEEDMEFPEKSYFGSLSRKRQAIKVEYRRLRRVNRCCSCWGTVYPVNSNGEYDVNGNRYKRSYRGSRSKYLKKRCNKQLRSSRLRNLRLIGNVYRKATEFWWELY